MFEILSPCCRWTSFTPAGVGVFFGHGCFLLLGVASAENDRKNDAEFAKDWWFERRGCTVEESDAVETRDAVETHAESKTLNIPHRYRALGKPASTLEVCILKQRKESETSYYY